MNLYCNFIFSLLKCTLLNVSWDMNFMSILFHNSLFQETNKKIHKMISRRGDVTLRRHLAKESINGCRRRWATERSLGNWVRGCQEVTPSSMFQELIHWVPHFLCFGLSPLSFYICCLASPESKSRWRSSAYSRLATPLLLLERTRANKGTEVSQLLPLLLTSPNCHSCLLGLCLQNY